MECFNQSMEEGVVLSFPSGRCRRFSLLAALAGAMLITARASLLDSPVELKGVAVPVYLDSRPEPAAILRADRIFRDYQRRGFFRIGVLPLVVFEGLNLEIREPERLSAALSAVSGQFAVKDNVKKAVEGREFTLRLGQEGDGQLRARRVRLEDGTVWRLQEGSVERAGAAAIAFRRATLTITGARAGELTCETTNGAVQLHLLSLLKKNNP
jgi:hypothetical protein